MASLKRCEELWKVLIAHPKFDKEDAYKFLRWDLEDDVDDSLCPACEYETTHRGDHCGRRCIVEWGTEDGMCTDMDSPFEDWCGYQYDHKWKKATECAKEVLKLVRKSIRKLNK